MRRRTFLTAGAGAAVAAGLAGPLALPSAAGAHPLRMLQATGLSWPESQALPRFAAPDQLVVADLSGRPADQTLLLSTLQGVVNRTKPRVYLVASVSEGKTTWLNDLGVPYTTSANPLELVSTYRSELRGAIVPDPLLPATTNLATTLAGLEGAVACSAELAGQLGLPILVDLRGRFTTELDAYTWAVDTLWPQTTHRMLVNLNPTITAYLRDYAVANKALTVWLDHSDMAQRALLERLAADMPTNSPMVGWLRGGESPTVETLSRHSVYVVPADTSQNLTVLGGLSAPINDSPYRGSMPALDNRIYVTLTYSDGDNLQYAQHRMRVLWDNPGRGSVPVNWPVPPEILDAAPTILSHYQRTATEADQIVSGPSGLGYAFPSAWPDDTFDTYARRTARYTTSAGMTSTVVLNRLNSVYEPIPEVRAATYARHVKPDGLFQNWSDFVTDDLVLADLPVARSRMALTQDELRIGLDRAAAAWEARGGGPVFIMIFLHAWTMLPSDAALVAGERDSRYSFVRGDQFFGLLRAAHGLPAYQV